MRWDSDHVVAFDEWPPHTRDFSRVRLHASINRIRAWVTGHRSVQKALLFALLEPAMKQLQDDCDFTALQVSHEEYKMMPLGDIWNEFLRREGVPADYLTEVRKYEKNVLSKRKQKFIIKRVLNSKCSCV